MKLEEFLLLNASEPLSKITSAVAASSVKVWEGIPSNLGLLAAVNPSGEKQKEIDVFSNGVFTESLLASGAVSEVASEEMAEPAKGDGEVSVAMDPLDGSSNVGTNNPVGSIFGFYSRALPCSGRFLLGALFVTYGGMLTLTLSFGKGTHRFVAVRHGSAFSYELLDSKIRIPEEGGVYGFGGRRRDWVPSVQRFVDSLEERGLKMRYCGTFVGDYNQVLAHGGIFAYPALRGRPQGKLRVLYETAPMAFITQQAGGYATDGRRDLLDVEPKSLSEPSPVYLGSAPLAREVERMLSAAM
ncbi:MAG: fructose-1,6-bisphosphatase [Nitrososphaerales archaeon]|nr:fructose-1,6-bisphosphatase [Nitrososphaerales archaeon]